MWGEAPGTAPGGEGSNARPPGLTGREELVTARVCRRERGNEEKDGRKAAWLRPHGARPHVPWTPMGQPRGQRGTHQLSAVKTVTPPPQAREHFASLRDPGLGAKLNSHMFNLLITNDVWTIHDVCE